MRRPTTTTTAVDVARGVLGLLVGVVLFGVSVWLCAGGGGGSGGDRVTAAACASFPSTAALHGNRSALVALFAATLVDRLPVTRVLDRLALWMRCAPAVLDSCHFLLHQLAARVRQRYLQQSPPSPPSPPPSPPSPSSPSPSSSSPSSPLSSSAKVDGLRLWLEVTRNADDAVPPLADDTSARLARWFDERASAARASNSHGRAPALDAAVARSRLSALLDVRDVAADVNWQRSIECNGGFLHGHVELWLKHARHPDASLRNDNDDGGGGVDNNSDKNNARRRRGDDDADSPSSVALPTLYERVAAVAALADALGAALPRGEWIVPWEVRHGLGHGLLMWATIEEHTLATTTGAGAATRDDADADSESSALGHPRNAPFRPVLGALRRCFDAAYAIAARAGVDSSTHNDVFNGVVMEAYTNIAAAMSDAHIVRVADAPLLSTLYAWIAEQFAPHATRYGRRFASESGHYAAMSLMLNEHLRPRGVYVDTVRWCLRSFVDEYDATSSSPPRTTLPGVTPERVLQQCARSLGVKAFKESLGERPQSVLRRACQPLLVEPPSFAAVAAAAVAAAAANSDNSSDNNDDNTQRRDVDAVPMPARCAAFDACVGGAWSYLSMMVRNEWRGTFEHPWPHTDAQHVAAQLTAQLDDDERVNWSLVLARCPRSNGG